MPASDPLSRNRLPHALKISADVTEEEYRRVRRQLLFVRLFTFGGLLGATLLWFTGILRVSIPILWFVPQGVAGGAIAHVIARSIWRESAKASTLRIQGYPKFRAFLGGRTLID